MVPPMIQQRARLPRVGILAAFDPHPTTDLDAAFQAGLREHGWIEGQNFTLEYRSAEGQEDRLPALAAELAGSAVDVIVVMGGTPAAEAARAATATIPIVLALVNDPLSVGLVPSLAQPGGNITGLSLLSTGLAPKRLELLKEVVPTLSHVANVWRAASADQTAVIRETEGAARTLGLRVSTLAIREVADLDAAHAFVQRERVDGMIGFCDPLLFGRRKNLITFADTARLPAIFDTRQYADDGALLAYGPSLAEAARRAAGYVDKILKGSSPGDLPVEQPTRFELVVNLTAAQALGLTMPQSVLLQATEIIR
jgi:putative ABC transport system substrate-binding protein